MIQVSFSISSDKEIKKFKMVGHAEAGPYGSDIVCAAASALAIGTINNIKRLTREELSIEAAEKEGGYLDVSLKRQERTRSFEDAQLLLWNFYYSMKDIQESYSKYMTITKKEIA